MSCNIKTGKEISQNIFDLTISWSENPYLMNVPEQLKKETQIKWVSLSWLRGQIRHLMNDTGDSNMLVAYSNVLSLFEEEEKQ